MIVKAFSKVYKNEGFYLFTYLNLKIMQSMVIYECVGSQRGYGLLELAAAESTTSIDSVDWNLFLVIFGNLKVGVEKTTTHAH